VRGVGSSNLPVPTKKLNSEHEGHEGGNKGHE
jgi:hypothetical protein